MADCINEYCVNPACTCDPCECSEDNRCECCDEQYSTWGDTTIGME